MSRLSEGVPDRWSFGPALADSVGVRENSVRFRALAAIRRRGIAGAARDAGHVSINAARLVFYRDLLGIRYYERKVHDYRLVLDLHDGGIGRQLMERGTREEEHAYILERELRPGDCVLDLGANIGYYSVMMARLVGSTGHVYAAEPSAPNFHLLNVNLRLNGVEETVTTSNVAIGQLTGSGRFYLSALSNCHTFCPEGIADEIAAFGPSVVDVEVIGIIDFLDGKCHVNLLRMDIEGYEVEVLEGLVSNPSIAPDRVLFETHREAYGDGRRMRNVLRQLFEHGYTARWVAADWYVERNAAAVYDQLGYGSHFEARFPACDRALYRDVRMDDAIDLIATSDFVRAIMLQKTR